MDESAQIAVLPGDGVGHEVITEAIKILHIVAPNFKLIFCDVGSQAYNDTGTSIPAETMEICEEADAILLGAIGHSYAPYGIPALVTKFFRQEKEAYANICPIKLYPGIYTEDDPRSNQAIDIILIRSNLEGFVLEHDGDLEEEIGRDVRVITRSGSKRIVDFAFEYSLKKKRAKITCIDAHNLLYGDKLFRNVFSEVGSKFPNINTHFLSVNVASMLLNMNPNLFDVILTHDIFGDMMVWQLIGKTGGIGIASQASIGENFAVFQPVGGAAWEIAGKGLANPIGSILSVKMMLEWLDFKHEAQLIENAVRDIIKEGEYLTPDLGGISKTSEVGKRIKDQVCLYIKNGSE